MHLVASTFLNFASITWSQLFTDVLLMETTPISLDFTVLNFGCYNLCSETRRTNDCLFDGKYCAYPPPENTQFPVTPLGKDLLTSSILLQCILADSSTVETFLNLKKKLTEKFQDTLSNLAQNMCLKT